MMNTKLISLIPSGVTASTVSMPALAAGNHAHHLNGHFHTRPDSHATVSVMCDHLMRTGETTLTRRYMRMDMDGRRHETDLPFTAITQYTS